MSAPSTWSDLIVEELGPLLERIELEGGEGLDVDDAARVLVLMARAEQLGSPAPLAPLLHRGLPHIAELAAHAPLDESTPLLVELDAVCQEGEDPHDVLLDLDDWLSVAVFLERHGVALPAAAQGVERRRVARFVAARVALSPERVAPLGNWVLSRVWSLEPEERVSGPEPYSEVVELWQAVAEAVLSEIAEAAPVALRPARSSVEAIVRDLVSAFPPARHPAPTGMGVRRILEAISLAWFIPREALASSGIYLGPEPVELHRWGDALLKLVVGRDLKTPLLQVSGTGKGEVPEGVREGVPLAFVRDEFETWLTDARPGQYRVTLRGETVEFILTSP